ITRTFEGGLDGGGSDCVPPQDWTYCRPAFSLSLNVILNPLRSLTIRNLYRRILETVRGNAGQGSADSSVKPNLDRPNDIGYDATAVGRVFDCKFQVNL